ncbi:MAG: hypothetical protein ACRD1Z_16265, partial [Vicinamibacteria bacterium]
PGRGRFAMGQAPATQDIPQVYEIGQFELAKRTDEELKRLYVFVQTSISVRTKCASLSRVSAEITGRPTLLSYYRSTPEGQAFVDTLAASKGFFLAATQPNILRSLQNLQIDLEVNHLKKRGYAIRGRNPVYRNDISELSYADTRVDPDPNVAVKETLDFGDLSKTRLYDDVNTLRLIASNMQIEGMPSLGVEPVTTGIIILAIIKYVIFPLILAIGLWAAVDSFNSKSITIDLPPGFDKLSPDIQKMILEGKSFLEQTKELLKWVAVGAGILTVGGVVLYFIRK